jgi:adenine-specific DNA-methyltransferase
MNKLDLQTPDFTSANIARLAELFPNCVTEKKNSDGTLRRAIDFDLLSQELSHDLVEGPQERYRLDWPGKRAALALANAPIRKTLRPSRDQSVDFDTTRNLYLEGDNLDALKLLQETYLGQVTMMYIDPPYNTGNDFIYDDDFSMNRADYQESSGEVDAEGRALFDEEKWKQNSTSSGRFHSEWLSMMYPRLKLARNLMCEGGLIFISIDDGEVANLRKICDEIFGEGNLVAQICHKSRASVSNDKIISQNHNTILMFARDHQTVFEKRKLIGLDPDLTGFSNPDNDPRGDYKMTPVDGPGGAKKGNPHYEFLGVTGFFRYSKATMEQKHRDGLIVKTKNGLQQKYFLTEAKISRKTATTWWDDGGLTSTATRRLQELLGGKSFDTPKPVELIERMLKLASFSPNDDIILDFFSGSATTAHAVMQLNAEDGGKRRHIMVQLPEPCDEKSEAFKAGYKTIAEIGKERIRRAGKKILSEWQAKQAKEKPAQGDLLTPSSEFPVPHSPPDIGFRVLKVDSSNMADVYYQPDELTQDTLALHVDNLKPGRKPEDLLFQVLLDWGVDLALPITEEKIAGRRVFFVADNALAACFDTGLDEEFVKTLAKRAPLRAVFRDAGYASDAVKINIEQIFKALSPHTELKTL